MSMRPAFAFLRRGDDPPIVPRSGWAAALTALAMSYLAVLTLSAGIAAERLAETWRSELAGVATVRISVPADALEARVTAVLAVLATAPGVADARLLSDAEHLLLLEPWLGAGDWLDDLPVPRLIEVRIYAPGPDATTLQAQLDATAPGAVYDDHALWREPLVRAATALRRLAARATLGGLAGAALGCSSVALMPELAPGTPLALGPGPVGWAILLLAIPAAAAAIAWATARHSVRLLLRQMY